MMDVYTVKQRKLQLYLYNRCPFEQDCSYFMLLIFLLFKFKFHSDVSHYTNFILAHFSLQRGHLSVITLLQDTVQSTLK